MSINKLLVHVAAAELTNAAMQGVGGASLPIDPTLADANVRNRNLHTWETHRVFYAALAQTLDSDAWADPQIDLGGLLNGIDAGGLVQKALALLPTLVANPIVGPILSALISKLGGVVSAIPTPPASTPAAPTPVAPVPAPAAFFDASALPAPPQSPRQVLPMYHDA